MFATQAERREFIQKNLPAYVRGHERFSLSRQGQIYRQCPETHELLKQEAADYLDIANRRVAALRDEVGELEQRLQLKRAELSKFEAIARVKGSEHKAA